jgi:transcriptional regulator with XRE-family HTH domain
MSEFARLIRTTRQKNGLSTREVAEATGMKPFQVSGMERGTCESYVRAARVIFALDIDPAKAFQIAAKDKVPLRGLAAVRKRAAR